MPPGWALKDDCGLNVRAGELGRKERSGLREQCEEKPGGQHREWQRLKPNEGKVLHVPSRGYGLDLGGIRVWFWSQGWGHLI